MSNLFREGLKVAIVHTHVDTQWVWATSVHTEHTAILLQFQSTIPKGPPFWKPLFTVVAGNNYCWYCHNQTTDPSPNPNRKLSLLEMAENGGTSEWRGDTSAAHHSGCSVIWTVLCFALMAWRTQMMKPWSCTADDVQYTTDDITATLQSLLTQRAWFQ